MNSKVLSQDLVDEHSVYKPQFPQRVLLGPNEIIAITGGSGFLGQHIVRVLQERGDGIKEIRILDIEKFEKKLDYSSRIEVKWHKVDVKNVKEVEEGLKGCTSIIHAASVISIGHFIDKKELHAVNVEGTSNVIKSCLKLGINKIVLTSTVDCIVSHSSVFLTQNELGVEYPEKESDFLVGYYGYTKAEAEKLMISLIKNKSMKFVILRPTVLYGELDPYYIPNVLKMAKSMKGKLPIPKIFQGEPILQSTYAGNAAWAHSLALWRLNEEMKMEKQNSQIESFRKTNGEEMFITDDTHPEGIYEFAQPFLKLHEYSTVDICVPLCVVLFFSYLFTCFVKLLPSSLKKKIDRIPGCQPYGVVKMTHAALNFTRLKATICLKYSPIYSEEQSIELSKKYYKNIQF